MTFLKEEERRILQEQGWLSPEERYLFAIGFHCPICTFITFNKYRVGQHGCADDRNWAQSDFRYATYRS